MCYYHNYYLSVQAMLGVYIKRICFREVLFSLDGTIAVEFGDGNKFVANASPPSFEFYKRNTLVAVTNGRGRFTVVS